MINPLYMEDLNEIQSMTEESRQRFQVTDIHSLNWVLRKLAALELKKAEANEVADREIERIEAFRRRELDAIQKDGDFLRGLISEYAIRQRDEDPKWKAKTPYGTVSFRKQLPKWHYNDDQLVSFLEDSGYDTLIRTKKEPVKTEIKKLFKVNDDGRVFDEDGIQVDGIMVEFLPETLDVKVEV